MKTAVVTGAGGGLGRAITAELVRRGFAVWATNVELGPAEEAIEGLGAQCRAAVLDVVDANACRELADDIVAGRGHLDLWVNNAGVLAVGYAWEVDDASNEWVLAVNATGTIYGTIAALDQMAPAGRGQVINVVSMAGIVATPGQAVYAASKHAAAGFTLSTLFDLRRGGHRGITICVVCPSGVWTPLINDRLDDPEAAASFTALLLATDKDRRRRRQAHRAPPPGDDRAPPAGRDDALRRPVPASRRARCARVDAGRRAPAAALPASGRGGAIAVSPQAPGSQWSRDDVGPSVADGPGATTRPGRMFGRQVRPSVLLARPRPKTMAHAYAPKGATCNYA